MKNRTSSPAHTPGPWHVRRNAETPLYVAAKGQHGFLCVTDVWGTEEQGEIDNAARANACLIAAAPELLDCLEIAANRLKASLMAEHEGTGEYQDLKWVLDTLNAVIAKARGR